MKHYSISFLPPPTLLSPSGTLEGLFELTWRPSRALKLASCVALETTEKQRTQSKTADANLNSAFVEKELFCTDP